jgi:nucleoside-diphosphate-sugar epimerase
VVFPASNDPHNAIFRDALQQQTLSQVAEISIQLVVSRSGSLLGRMATYNKLNNGVPIEIIPVDDPRIWAPVETVLPILLAKGLRGPLNLQGRLNEKGLQLYEMNARFTGITGLRALMGFNEVEALIADFSGRRHSGAGSLKNNVRRIGMRQTGDRCIDRDVDVNVKNTIRRTGLYPWEGRGKTVLVTGATGYLGTNLIKALLKTGWVEEVVALIRDEKKAGRLRTSAGPERLRLASWQDLIDGRLSFGHIDILCHAAFGRCENGRLQTSDGLARTQELATLVAKFQLPAVLNISCQSVYGLSRPPLWSEDIPPLPESPYAASKWASELMMTSVAQLCPTIRVTSVRLAQLYGLAEGMRWAETPHVLARSAAFGHPLVIEGGTQSIDYLHINDAVAGLLAIMSTSPDGWHPVYNLGSGKPVRLIDLADHIAESAHRLSGVPVRVNVNAGHIKLSLGMSIDRIRKTTGWAPLRSIQSGIEEIIMAALRTRR